MSGTGKLDITGVDLAKFVQAVYQLSRPQGMGFLHYKDAPLSADEISEIVNRNTSSYWVLGMDYVNGRSCKMDVRREPDGCLTISSRWYDHTDTQLDELLREVGVGKKPYVPVAGAV